MKISHMSNPPFLIASILILLGFDSSRGRMDTEEQVLWSAYAKALSDDRVWYASNKVGGWLFIVSSLNYFGIAAIVPYSADSTSFNWWAHILGLLLPLFISFFIIHFYSKRF